MCFSGESNYKLEFLLKTRFFLLACAVILHLALCWKHDLKNSFLRQMSKTSISPKIPTSKNVKDNKNKNRIIFRYCLHRLTHSNMF